MFGSHCVIMKTDLESDDNICVSSSDELEISIYDYIKYKNFVKTLLEHVMICCAYIYIYI